MTIAKRLLAYLDHLQVKHDAEISYVIGALLIFLWLVSWVTFGHMGK